MKRTKLTKEFLKSLPLGTIVLSNLYFPFGFLSWKVEEDVDEIWKDVKNLGADQRLAMAFDTVEEYEAEVEGILESVGQKIPFNRQNWSERKAV